MAYWGRSFETSDLHFTKHFGPTRYSFNKGNIHYIVLNNNFYIGRDYFYMGYIDEETFKWLERDLSFVAKGKTVFVMVHIPTQLKADKEPFVYNYSVLGGTTVNASSLYKLLENYTVHILSGHTHQSNNIEHHNRLYEHNIAASSGSWWQMDLCTDGTPRGYKVFEIDGDKVKWYYKSAGFNKDYQFRASINEDGELIANAWGYDSKWKIEWFEDGQYKGEMEQFIGIDPTVYLLTKDRSKFKYNWIDASPTNHLFKSKINKSAKSISIKVKDRFGNIYQQKITNY